METKEVINLLYFADEDVKISHLYFSNNEFIEKKDNDVKTEDGYHIDRFSEFWDIRRDWTGWYIKN